MFYYLIAKNGNGGYSVASADGAGRSAGGETPTNWAASANGGSATASSYSSPYAAAGANNGLRYSATYGDYWIPNNYNNANGYGCTWSPQEWLKITFTTAGGPKKISEVDIIGYTTVNAQPGMEWTSAGLRTFDIQYCPSGTTCVDTGAGWVTLTGTIDYNYQVMRRFTFPTVLATAVRVLPYCEGTTAGSDKWLRVVELEAWDTSGNGLNVASAAYGGSAVASSVYNSGYPVTNALDGDRTSWGEGTATGGSWASLSTPTTSAPQTYDVTFSEARKISEVDLFFLQSSYANAIDPYPGQTGTLANHTFDLQYWNTGLNAWSNIGSTVLANNLVWKQFLFAPITTNKVRVNITGLSGDYYAHLVEVEAYTTDAWPDMPTNVAVTPKVNAATITWAAKPGASGYNVRATLGSTTNTYSPGNVTSYTITGLTGGSTYSFSVAATNTSGSSNYSTPIAATPVASCTADSQCLNAGDVCCNGSCQAPACTSDSQCTTKGNVCHACGGCY